MTPDFCTPAGFLASFLALLPPCRSHTAARVSLPRFQSVQVSPLLRTVASYCFQSFTTACVDLHTLAQEADLASSLGPLPTGSSHVAVFGFLHAPGWLRHQAFAWAIPYSPACPSPWPAPSLPTDLEFSERPSQYTLWSLPNKMTN